MSPARQNSGVTTHTWVKVLKLLHELLRMYIVFVNYKQIISNKTFVMKYRWDGFQPLLYRCVDVVFIHCVHEFEQ